MANPTTNYGFVLPTPTDLVTDLPADFDVALQGVDTRLKALQPGTTLGDLAYSSATANTNTRLGIGTTGQVLTVAGGVPSWATSASGGITQIATGTLTGASVTISSIVGTYKKLYLVIANARCSSAGMAIRFNSDSGTNYQYNFYDSNSSVNSADTQAQMAWDNTGATSTHRLVTFEIPFYTNTSVYKFVSIYGGRSAQTPFNQTGVWKSTAAITAINMVTYAATADFDAGNYTLYGVN